MAYKVISIGDKEVPMLATASTPEYCKRIFHVDPIRLQSAKEKDAADYIDLYRRLAFVMAKQAETKCNRKELSALNEDSYLDWLDQFSYDDFSEAMEDIISVYEGQKVSTSEEKKEEG